VGAVGAAVIVVSLAKSLAGLLRQYRDERRVRVMPILANVVLAVSFVMMPLMHLARAVTPPQAGAVRILADFGDWGAPRAIRDSVAIAGSTSQAAWAPMCSQRLGAGSSWHATTATSVG
jgi:hypothetical protein